MERESSEQRDYPHDTPEIQYDPLAHESLDDAAITSPAEGDDVPGVDAEMPSGPINFDPHQFDFQDEPQPEAAAEAADIQYLAVNEALGRFPDFQDVFFPADDSDERAVVLQLERKTTEGKAIITLSGLVYPAGDREDIKDIKTAIRMIPGQSPAEGEHFEYAGSDEAVVRWDTSAAEQALRPPIDIYGQTIDDVRRQVVSHLSQVKEGREIATFLGLGGRAVSPQEMAAVQDLIADAKPRQVPFTHLYQAFASYIEHRQKGDADLLSTKDVLDQVNAAIQFQHDVRLYMERNAIEPGRFNTYESSDRTLHVQVGQQGGLNDSNSNEPFVSLTAEVPMEQKQLEQFGVDDYEGPRLRLKSTMDFRLAVADNPHPIITELGLPNLYLRCLLSVQLLGEPDEDPIVFPLREMPASTQYSRLIRNFIDDPLLEDT